MGGLDYRDIVTEWELPPGTFFDLAVVHLLTMATIERLRALYPEGRFEVRRFRPNVVAMGADRQGFVENDWVGQTLAIGDEVRLRTRGSRRARPAPRDSGLTHASSPQPESESPLPDSKGNTEVAGLLHARREGLPVATMKSVQTGEQNTIEVDLECPVPGPGTPLVRIRARGICGTDVSFLHMGGIPVGPGGSIISLPLATSRPARSSKWAPRSGREGRRPRGRQPAARARINLEAGHRHDAIVDLFVGLDTRLSRPARR
jgi:hypothetical protein